MLPNIPIELRKIANSQVMADSPQVTGRDKRGEEFVFGWLGRDLTGVKVLVSLLLAFHIIYPIINEELIV